MKKRILIIFFVVCGLGLWKLNKDILLLWNANTIKVTAKSPLTTDKVKIEFGVSVDRETDTDIFYRREEYMILYDGNIRNVIINEYGENDFLITYDNKYYFHFRHFKTNRRHQHGYYFKFHTKHDSVFVKVNIEGIDQMKLERSMIAQE